MGAAAIIALIEGIISTAPAALALWEQLKPILSGGLSTAPTAAQPAILAAVEAIIADTPEALALWQAVAPVLVGGQPPSDAEWAALNALADAAHAAGAVVSPPSP